MTDMTDEHRRTLMRQVHGICAGLTDDPKDIRFIYQQLGVVIERDYLVRIDGRDPELRPTP